VVISFRSVFDIIDVSICFSMGFIVKFSANVVSYGLGIWVVDFLVSWVVGDVV
jgi:hypothetical protein